VLPLDFVFVAKVEATRWPLVGLFLRRGEHLSVDRGDAQDSLATNERVAATLRGGRSVLVFPEATFTAAAGLRPFRLGAFKTAVELSLPVVPLALQGVRRMLRDRTWLPRPGRLRVFVGAPVAPAGSDWHAVVDLRDRVAAAIAAECGEPRLDLVTSVPAAPPHP
jgi:1-acyl-sn-glycerol-3-phosphate acyltransferase